MRSTRTRPAGLLSACLLATCLAACASSEPDTTDAAAVFDSSAPADAVGLDAPALDAQPAADALLSPDGAPIDTGELDAGPDDTGPDDTGPDDTGVADAGSACDPNPCFAGVTCTDDAAAPMGFRCGACPIGYDGDGVTCADLDACASSPCLAGTTCADLPAPDPGFTCTACVGPTCPILRAQAGADQEVVLGAVATLSGSATGYNGAFRCEWRNDQTADVLGTCTATVAPLADTVFTLTVIDASGATASDTMVMRLVRLIADAGPAQNITFGDTATLTASWRGASCSDASCIACRWALDDGTVVARTCSATVSPTVTTRYVLTVSDSGTAEEASDGAMIYVTDRAANLCGWNVVILTSNSYPTAANPNYICSPDGSARRQTVNGKPSIVLSDLVVENARITGHIGVETATDDDLIGFLWGFENGSHFYLLSWKQITQPFGACGNALAGIAVKKVDAAANAATGISFNNTFGFNATDYVHLCATGWSTDRNNQNLLTDGTTFLYSPRDPGAITTGWTDFITYRFEFYYTPARTKIMVYADDARTGSTANPVGELTIEDSSFPRGRFAFYSNSQEQVDFGDFVLASLDGYTADAGADQAISAGQTATLSGTAELAVPPYRCTWTAGTATATIASTCDAMVTPAADTTYTLRVEDDFSRVTTDQVTVRVSP